MTGNKAGIEISANGYSRNSIVREFPYSQADFEQVRRIIYDHAGISLSVHKKDLVYNRLVRRVRVLQLNSVSDYVSLIEHSTDEMSNFVNAMTTNLTSFYREAHHFEYITQTLIPTMIEREQYRLRIWSCACSIGEEPYSIAISLLEAGIEPNLWDIKILATDIDTEVLAQAKMGIYPIKRIESLSLARKKIGFLKGKNRNQDQVMVKSMIKDMMTFNYCNLMKPWQLTEPLDIIFCRNVMIYFDKKTQINLLDRMTKQLKPGGILFLGHSESPARDMSDYTLLGRTMYKKL